MAYHLNRLSEPLPEEQHMDVEAIRNLRGFIAILQGWDRADSMETKTTRRCRLIESRFTSTRESDMS